MKDGEKLLSAELLEKMIQCATLASQMLNQASGGGTTTSSYSSLSGANGIPAMTSVTTTSTNPNTREDSKEGVLNGSTTSNTNPAAATPTTATPTTGSAAPSSKKQVCLGPSLTHFLLILCTRKRKTGLQATQKTKARHVWVVMPRRRQNGGAGPWVRSDMHHK